ncbi:MAG: DUF6569 family protein [Hyphomicrobiaceae bacterium]
MTLRFGLPLLAMGLAAIGVLSGAAAADPKRRVSAPLQHGNLSIFLIHGASAPGPVPLTLQEALAKGTVEVLETGKVSELKIRNTGDEPVFVQMGDIVKGGRQDRVLTLSMLLEPKSGDVPVGAYCVEQGRWSARGKEDARRFALSEAMMPSREAKVALARTHAANDAAAPALRTAPSQRTDGRTTSGLTANIIREQRRADIQVQRRGSDGQGEVWRSVAKVQRELSANLTASVASERSRTSLQLSLENEALKKAQGEFLAALEPAGLEADDVVGVVVAVDGKLSTADLYPSNGLFRKMWPKLVRAAVTEALAAGKGSQGSAPPAASPAPGVPAVEAFLASADAGKAHSRAIGSVAQLETRDTDKAIKVEARSTKGALLHTNFVAK